MGIWVGHGKSAEFLVLSVAVNVVQEGSNEGADLDSGADAGGGVLGAVANSSFANVDDALTDTLEERTNAQVVELLVVVIWRKACCVHVCLMCLFNL